MAIQSVRQLHVWRIGHELTVQVYSISAIFPKNELHGLVSQMRRASVSIPANIAEGFGRTSLKEKCRFYDIARGSLEEVMYYIFLAKELRYISQATHDALNTLCIEQRKTLCGALKILRKRQ